MGERTVFPPTFVPLPAYCRARTPTSTAMIAITIMISIRLQPRADDLDRFIDLLLIQDRSRRRAVREQGEQFLRVVHALPIRDADRRDFPSLRRRDRIENAH